MGPFYVIEITHLQELTNKSYLELLELTTLRLSERQLEELRKLTEQERKAEQEKIKREEESVKKQREQARKQLKKFNSEASRDTPEVAAHLETEVAAMMIKKQALVGLSLNGSNHTGAER